jgi:hypothetical protein
MYTPDMKAGPFGQGGTFGQGKPGAKRLKATQDSRAGFANEPPARRAPDRQGH